MLALRTECCTKKPRFGKLIKTKQDIIFKIFNSIHNEVLEFKNYVTQVAAFIEPLPVLFHETAGHFGRNGSNFLGYRLLKTFQSLGTMFVYQAFEVFKLHGNTSKILSLSLSATQTRVIQQSEE
jgi:hypothetical protein